MSKPLRFHEYSHTWVSDFNAIRDFLAYHLEGYYTAIHHVGSTSVKHLGAKPIIDIDIEYKDSLQQIISILERNGYVYEGEKGIVGRHAFKQTTNTHSEHHLYAILTGHKELIKHITFRDALRNYRALRTQYHNLKKQLITQNNTDRVLYTNSKTDVIEYIMKASERMKTIIFAGGCFWGVEAYFKLIEGVKNTEVGYINGDSEATYYEVCNGSGHSEAVSIDYDPSEVTLQVLLDHLFNIIDPTSINKQGPDIGIQYRTGIYNYTPEELLIIKEYFNKRAPEFKRPIAIELVTDQTFYKAEENHQDYLDKNKNGYCHVDLKSHNNV